MAETTNKNGMFYARDKECTQWKSERKSKSEIVQKLIAIINNRLKCSSV